VRADSAGGSTAYLRAVNVPPYILQQGIAARHADLVRQADAARLARRPSRRFRLRLVVIRRPRPGFWARLRLET